MAKASELRDMSDEQIRAHLERGVRNLFRLRIQVADRAARCSDGIEETPPADRPLPDHFERARPYRRSEK